MILFEGKPLLVDGRLALDPACCCDDVPEGNTCVCCPGITPAAMKVTVSGHPNPAFNTTFTVPQDPAEPCQWILTSGVPDDMQISVGLACGEDPLRIVGFAHSDGITLESQFSDNEAVEDRLAIGALPFTSHGPSHIYDWSGVSVEVGT